MSVVRLIMVSPLYKRHNWTIPIERQGNVYVTGQDLPYKKQIGETPLTPEEEKKYPVVIDPRNFYKAVDRKYYDLDDAYSKAMYDLMLVSGKIAKSESEYKKKRIQYVGYFFDANADAIDQNAFFDLSFEAEERIRKTPEIDQKKIILALNYKLKDFDFNLSSATTADRMRNELIKACRKYPREVLNCFDDHNPGIEDELFFIELIHAHIITKKQDGTLMYGAKVLGSTFDDIKKLLLKENDAYLRNKWALQLDEAKNLTPAGSAEKYEKNLKKSGEDPYEQMQVVEAKVKEDLFDGNVEEAKKNLKLLKTLFKEVISSGKDAPPPDFEYFESVIKELESGPPDFTNISLERLQAYVKNPRHKLKVSEFKEIMDDRDAIILKLTT